MSQFTVATVTASMITIVINTVMGKIHIISDNCQDLQIALSKSQVLVTLPWHCESKYARCLYCFKSESVS